MSQKVLSANLRIAYNTTVGLSYWVYNGSRINAPCFVIVCRRTLAKGITSWLEKDFMATLPLHLFKGRGSPEGDMQCAISVIKYLNKHSTEVVTSMGRGHKVVKPVAKRDKVLAQELPEPYVECLLTHKDGAVDIGRLDHNKKSWQVHTYQSSVKYGRTWCVKDVILFIPIQDAINLSSATKEFIETCPDINSIGNQLKLAKMVLKMVGSGNDEE